MCSLNGRRASPPPSSIMMTIEHRMATKPEHAIHSLLIHISFLYPFLEPHHTTNHSNIGILIRNLIELGLSTLPKGGVETLNTIIKPGDYNPKIKLI